MTTRKYSSRAQQSTLSSGITSGDTNMTVGSGANLMGGKTPAVGETYTVVVDPDTALEEIVDVSNYSSGNSLIITRGVDGSTAVAHSAGAIVRHMVIGRDLSEANTHIEATTGHGATGAVVGTTNTQTLTNKTLTAPTITTPTVTGLTLNDSSIVFEGATADAFETTLTVVDPTADRTITLPDVTGTVVTTGDTATVTGTMIASDTIVNADINSAAAIAYSKLNLTGAIVNTDITNDTITNAKINTAAAIDWTKLGISSTVSSTEIGYVDGVTSAIQTQIDSKLATATASSTYAPLASPALTGVPTAPTAAANTNTTQVATTAYVQTELTDLIGGAPGALDTLNELAAALANDASYSTTITTALATKLPLAGGTMTGAIEMSTNKITGLGTPTVSTDAVTKAYADAILVGAPGNLTGPITSVGAVTSIASQTGTGTKFVVDTSPTLVTPVLGVATATSINGTSIPSTKTLVVTTDKLSTLAATTSSELAGVISDETGSGALVFADTPTLVTPVLGSATGTSLALTVASGTTVPLTIQNNGTGNSFIVNDVASDTTPFVIDNAGNVAIGTTSIGGKFSVTGAAAGVAAYFTDATNSSLAIATLSGGVTLGTDGGGQLHFATDGATAAKRRMSIDATGSVFIGTNVTAGQNTGGLTIQGKDIELMQIMGAY